MKKNQNLFILFMLVFLAASCTKEKDLVVTEDLNLTKELLLNDDELLEVLELEEEVESRTQPQSAVYVLSNQASGNQVIVFNRQNDGTITEAGRYDTGGTGTSGGLGNQEALAINKTGKFLYVINAGSNDFSFFYIKKNGGLVLLDKMHSGGEMPVSIAVRNGIIYVLNAGGEGNITGFGFNRRGKLMQLSNSTRPLSSSTAGAAQISFSSNGKALVVTEKATNTITSYALHNNRPSTPHTFPSAGATPFGFAFGKHNVFYVSEAAGGAAGASTVSSYRIDNQGQVSLVDGPFATNASAACWVVITQNNKNLFVTNTATNDISSLSASASGRLDFANGGNTTATGNGPIDAALDKHSNYLYVLTAGSDALFSYRVGANGALTRIDEDGGLPDGATGAVVR